MDSATSRTAARILRMLPRERITHALGHFTDIRVPQTLLKPVLNLYTRAYKVDLEEAVLPSEGFRTFNEFFTRRLRDGLRPIDPDPGTVVSPADGWLDDSGPVDLAHSFRVKGRPYDVAELLGSAADARPFAGGRYAVVYLSPRDYHRVHAPVAAHLEKLRHIPGTLFPVNRFGVQHVPRLLARNERVAMFFRSETFGSVAVVMVGAMIVGKITLAFDAPDRPVMGDLAAERVYGNGTTTGPIYFQKGAELGAFQLGSTVVLLLGPAPQGRLSPTHPVDQHVRLGQPLLRRSRG